MATNLDDEGQKPGARPVFTFIPRITPSDVATRQWISFLLLILMAGVVIAAFTGLFHINDSGLALSNEAAADAAADDERLMKLMNVVFGPLVTLFSSVVGFYFGAKTANETPASRK